MCIMYFGTLDNTLPFHICCSDRHNDPFFIVHKKKLNHVRWVREVEMVE